MNDLLQPDTFRMNAEMIANANKAVFSFVLRACELNDARICAALGINAELRDFLALQRLGSINLNSEASNVSVFVPAFGTKDMLDAVNENRCETVIEALEKQLDISSSFQSYTSVLSTLSEINRKLLNVWSDVASSQDPLAGILLGCKPEFLKMITTLPRAQFLSALQNHQLPIFKLRFSDFPTWKAICTNGFEDPLTQRELLKTLVA
jgi:hypothetical protein